VKIVVLDGFTLNPGDLSWDGLKELGHLTIYERTAEEDILSRSEGADALVTNKTSLNEESINALPGLKYIGVLATGYNVVDAAAAAARKIPVTNVPTYGTTAVAQLVFALLLEHCHHVKDHSDAVYAGKWSNHIDFCFWDFPLIELVGKTMGIVGFGRIGRAVGKIAAAFGMKVVAHDVYKADPPAEIADFAWAEIDELFAISDAVSLNCPLTPENTGMVNQKLLSLMKPTAFLINAARGGLVADADLAEALNSGTIAGAALDVVSNVEPPKLDNPLLKARNCIITPHIAWAAKESRARLMNTAVENLKAFIDGKPQNAVNL
jgi:glycerate dehydrogenase